MRSMFRSSLPCVRRDGRAARCVPAASGTELAPADTRACDRRCAGGMIEELFLQAAKAAAYYVGLLVLVRLAGKRMAGQTTTFDLLVLITLGVVLQTAALQRGTANALVFVVTVFALHRLTALLCARSRSIR